MLCNYPSACIKKYTKYINSQDTQGKRKDGGDKCRGKRAIGVLKTCKSGVGG